MPGWQVRARVRLQRTPASHPGLQLRGNSNRLRPAQRFAPEAQGFFLALCVRRSLRNGAFKSFDQLGDGREDRALVGGSRVTGILQTKLDSSFRPRDPLRA